MEVNLISGKRYLSYPTIVASSVLILLLIILAIFFGNLLHSRAAILQVPTPTRTPTPIRIGNFVWNDLNRDGGQDTGEPGLAGVTVQLWDSTKITMIDETTTNSSGLYSLTAPRPGDYCIRVLLPSAGETFSPKDNAGDDLTDSDINPSGPDAGYTDIFTIASNVISITTKDAGIYTIPTPTFTRTPTPINIGNFVWNDLNRDGVQDSGEPGLAGVTVQLWDSTKTTMIDQTTTNFSGLYRVTAPISGDYRIRVILARAGDAFSLKDNAGDDLTDSDINPSGPDAGYTDIFTIASNVISITTKDAGIIPDSTPEIEVRNGTTVIANGGQFDFGTTAVGTSLTATFTIYNLGINGLTVSLGTLPAGFSLMSSPTSPVAGGTSKSFNVQCDAASLGNYSGTISIANNDSDENPYEFTIVCQVSNVSTSTFTPTWTFTPTFTLTPTITSTPTYTLTSTLTPTVTSTETSTSTLTTTYTPTVTVTSTVTPTVTSTFTFTPTYTLTPTPSPVTFTPTWTLTPTSTSSSITATPSATLSSNSNNVPPSPPVNRCADENFIPDSSVRAAISDEVKNDLRCRIMVQDGHFLASANGPLYNWGNIGNRQLVDMGVIGAVDVFNTVGLRQFHDAVICLRGTGKIYLLNDTFSEAPRSPVETTAYTVPVWPGFTCATLYSPATVVLVRSDSAAIPPHVEIPLTNCRVYLRYALRLHSEPDINSTVKANIPFDQILPASAMVPGWYRVRYGIYEGWLSAQYLLLYGQCHAD